MGGTNRRGHAKAIVQDWQLLSTHDNDEQNARFYSLTDRQCAALIVMTEYLAWRTRYLNLPGDEDIELFASDTAYRLMNPVDPGECITYPPFATFITYEPNDPFRTPDLVPDGYIFPPWYIANTATQVTYDAELGCAVTTLERMPALSPLSGYPRFRVTVNGTGTITLNFASVNLGGMVQITVDDELPSIELIDLIQDKIAVPPETANIISKSYYFAVPGEHRVDCIMLPALQDQIPPVMFGGGLVSVQLCGFGLSMPQEGLMLRQSVVNPCILEQSSDGEVWSEAFNFAECPSIASGNDVTEIQTQNKITSYAAQQRQSEAANEAYLAEYTGDPSSINPDAPDDNFVGAGTLPETQAFCAALTAFVHSFAYAKIQQLDVVYAAGAGALALAAFLTGGLAFVLAIAANVLIGGAALAGALSYASARAALTDAQALADVVCCMKTALEALPITQANWNTALNACGFTAGSNAAIVRDFIAAELSNNYLVFCDMLGEANQAVGQQTPVDCECLFSETYHTYPEIDAHLNVQTPGSYTILHYLTVNAPHTITITLDETVRITSIILKMAREKSDNIFPEITATVNGNDYQYDLSELLCGGCELEVTVTMDETSNTIVLSATRDYWYVLWVNVNGI